MPRISRMFRAVMLMGLLASWCGVTAYADGQAAFGLAPTACDTDVSDTGASFVLNRQPGTTVQKLVRVTNAGSAAGSVRFYAVDATTAQESGIVFRNETDPRVDVGAWLSVNAGPVTLDPDESRDIAFTITVPASSRAGQHVGGIAAETVPPGSLGGGDAGVGIRSVTIIPVQVNLPGPVVERMTVTGMTLSGDQEHQGLFLGLRNDGTQILKPSGTITINIGQSQQVRQIPLALNAFLPQNAVQYPISLQAAMPAGEHNVSITLSYGASQQTIQSLLLEFFYAPALTAINPSAGSGNGGNIITLAGGMFGTLATTRVLIDGVVIPTSPMLSVSATRIRFTAPEHAAGTVTITVTVGGAVIGGSVPYLYSTVSEGPVQRPGSGITSGPPPSSDPVPRPGITSAGTPGQAPAARP